MEDNIKPSNVESFDFVMGMAKDMLMLKLSDEEKALAAGKISERVEYVNSMMQEVYDNWDKLYDLYNVKGTITEQGNTKKPKSAINTPLIRSHGETYTAMTSTQFMVDNGNYVKVVDPYYGERIYLIENLLYNTIRDGEYGFPLAQVRKSTYTCSKGYIKLYPDYEREMPRARAINPKELKIDPHAETIYDAQFVIHEFWQPIPDVMKKVEKGDYDKKIVDKWIQDRGIMLEHSLYEKAPCLMYDATTDKDVREVEDTTSNRFGRVKTWEYWDAHVVITVIDELFVVRAGQNVLGGYPFFEFMKTVPFPGETMPDSDAEMQVPLQQELDVKRNQRIDNVNKILAPPLLVSENAVLPGQKIVYANDNQILVRQGKIDEAIKPLPPIDATHQIQMEEVSIRADASDISHVKPANMGDPVKRERMTTGEVQAVYASSNIAFDYADAVGNVTGLVPMLKGILKMYSLMGVTAVASPTEGGRGNPMEIPIELLTHNYRISVSINPNKQQQDAQKAMMMYQMLSQHPMVNQPRLLDFTMKMVFPEYPADLFQPIPGQMLPQTGVQQQSQQGVDNNYKV